MEHCKNMEFIRNVLLCFGLGSIQALSLQDHTITKRSTTNETMFSIPTFECNTTYSSNTTNPTSVHRLRPCDVDVIAAMGDSLTAGMGIESQRSSQDIIMYRGLSFSGGGDESLDDGVVTLPNILRKYNPNIYGYATGSSFSSYDHPRLNVAKAAATASKMASQARTLIDLLKGTTADFKNEWKVITMFIGSYDLCIACRDWNTYSADNYVAGLQAALDLLQQEVPRTLVNVVLTLDISLVSSIGNGSSWCYSTQSVECPCSQNQAEGTEQAISDLADSYKNATQEFINTGRYDTTDDFTVVVQPFFKSTNPPVEADDPTTVDDSFFSHDCFHFSRSGQAISALALWNNMNQAVGEKEEDGFEIHDYLCPGTETTEGYFRTSQN